MSGHCTCSLSGGFLTRWIDTYGLSAALLGVARPDSSASRSFASIASARRFRKSSSWTRPTVCAERMSSAVFAWVVKRELGVDVPEFPSDVMAKIEDARQGADDWFAAG